MKSYSIFYSALLTLVLLSVTLSCNSNSNKASSASGMDSISDSTGGDSIKVSEKKTEAPRNPYFLPDDSIHTRYHYAFFANDDRHIVIAPFGDDPEERLLHPGHWGLIDYAGNEIVDGKNKWIVSASELGNMSFPNDYGYLPFGKKDGKMGVAKIKGSFEEVLPAIHNYVKVFGLYAAMETDDKGNDIYSLKSKRKVGHISADYEIMNISEDKIVARDRSKEGLCVLDLKGKILIPTENLKGYYKIGPFNEGLASVEAMPNYEIGFINDKGKVVIPVKYYNAEYRPMPIFRNGIAVLTQGAKFGGIDSKGKTIIPFKYDRLYFQDGELIGKRVEKPGKPLCLLRINNKGKEIGRYIPRHPSEEWQEYSDPTESKPGERWNRLEGYKDKNGKIVLPAKYVWCYPFENGYSLVSLDGRIVMINEKGKVVLDSLAMFNRAMLPG